jgi:hypothetical protein
MAKPVKYRFAIPETIDPPERFCLQIQVPNDPTHIANILGALQELTYGPAWESDDAHSAIECIRVWRELYAGLTIKNCPPPNPELAGLAEGEDQDMGIRVDCNCNVFVTCCDGTEKQILTADQVQAIVGGQPGQGAGIPQPGECLTYHAEIEAGRSWFLPTYVNTGDVITATKFDGASTDAAPLGRWNIYDGQQYQFGAGTGNKIHDSASPDPALFLGQVIAIIDGVYYDATHAITVPSGIVNQGVAFLLNYPSGGNFSGSITMNVEVCNNQSAAWSHDFDFTLSSGGWNPGYDPNGVQWMDWVNGVGWKTHGNGPLFGSQYYKIANLGFGLHHAGTINTFQVDWNDGTPSGGCADGGIAVASSFFILLPCPATKGAVHLSQTGLTQAWTDGQTLALEWYGDYETGSMPTGDLVISHLHATGTGSDPFVP